MINPDILLELKLFQSSSFSDFKVDGGDILRDATALTSLTGSTDYIYVGYRKQFFQVFAALETVNSANTMTAEYYNGTTWTSLALFDDTKGLTRDGNITWTQPTDWEANSVDSTEKYWIRFTLTTSAGCSLYGISGLFCDVRDILVEYPDIDDSEFALGKSLNYYFVAARNWILASMERKGLKKLDVNGIYRDLNLWDFLVAVELKQAATFYSLHKIFHSISDEETDEFGQKASYYMNRATKALAAYDITVDANDDGEIQNSERRVGVKYGTLLR